MPVKNAFPRLGKDLVVCRGCLGPLGPGSAAGLCGACWTGLIPLPEPRCPRCALPHSEASDCPEPCAWSKGDALWDYHGGRPPLGALLVPGIKAGEHGWRRELLRRAAAAHWPGRGLDFDLVTSAPTPGLRRLLRGFDLAEAFARQLALQHGLPYQPTLRKLWRYGHQSERTESARRRLPRRAIRVRGGCDLRGLRLLLVDDVWTTGTTLLRCTEALREQGVAEVQVLTLFRALRA